MDMLSTRKLGSQGLTVSSVGLGLMGKSHAYGTPDERALAPEQISGPRYAPAQQAQVDR